jgi:hypothetical protein
VVGGDDDPALGLAVLAAEPDEPEVDEKERQQNRPGDVVHRPVDTVLAGVGVVGGETLGGHAERYTSF